MMKTGALRGLGCPWGSNLGKIRCRGGTGTGLCLESKIPAVWEEKERRGGQVRGCCGHRVEEDSVVHSSSREMLRGGLVTDCRPGWRAGSRTRAELRVVRVLPDRQPDDRAAGASLANRKTRVEVQGNGLKVPLTLGRPSSLCPWEHGLSKVKSPLKWTSVSCLTV